MGQRIDLSVLALGAIYAAETREGVLTVDVHGAGPADTLATRPAEGQSGVDLVLDLDERVQDLTSGEYSAMISYKKGPVQDLP